MIGYLLFRDDRIVVSGFALYIDKPADGDYRKVEVVSGQIPVYLTGTLGGCNHAKNEISDFIPLFIERPKVPIGWHVRKGEISFAEMP